MSAVKRTFYLFLLMILLLILFFSSMNSSVNVYDEGLILTGALRVYWGDFPHRDFYANYGPAQFYILAFLFKLFEPLIFIERAFDLLVKAIIVIVSFKLIAKSLSLRYSISAGLLILLLMLAAGNHGYPVFQTYLLILISVIQMQRGLFSSEDSHHFLTSGLMIGFAALFRYDIGFLACVALLLSLIFYTLSFKVSDSSATNFYKPLLLFILGSATPVFSVLTIYFFNGSLDDFIHDVITFPIQNYAQTRGLPFPSKLRAENILIYFPFVLIVFSAVFILSRRIHVLRKEVSADQFFLIITMFFLTSFLSIKGLVRISFPHMIIAVLPAILLFYLVLDIAKRKFTSWYYLLSPFLIILCVSVAIFSIKPLSRTVTKEDGYLRLLASISKSDLSNSSDAKSDQNLGLLDWLNKPFIVSMEKDRLNAFNHLNDRLLPDDFFYSGLHQHDRIFINDVAMYFHLKRRPAIKHHHFDPALQNSLSVQREIVQQLSKNQPKYIMLDSSWSHVSEPNKSAWSTNVFLLDEFIDLHYALDQCFGKICLHKLKKVEK